MSEVLVEARDLAVHFAGHRPLFGAPEPAARAVDGIDLAIRPREMLALVGESGCGKSTAGRALLRLVDITAGTVRFEDRDLTALGEGALRPLRRRMQMVFQDPFASLNPRMTIGETVSEPLEVHGLARGAELAERVAATLAMVGFRPEWASRYPHEFSGGQRQRVAIARAVIVNPAFVVADEPLSALDVSLQLQILALFEELRERFDLTYLFISHDLALVARTADRVAVMYLGKIVEEGTAAAVFSAPAHPYTQALIAAVPIPDPAREAARVVVPLAGEIPSPTRPPSGCRFRTRCPHVMPVCTEVEPRLATVAPGQRAACHLHGTG
jgi:oligopeptide/dipeptide ABC transporter ATP-binding protein